jgi:hypothetical protein
LVRNPKGETEAAAVFMESPLLPPVEVVLSLLEAISLSPPSGLLEHPGLAHNA